MHLEHFVSSRLAYERTDLPSHRRNSSARIPASLQELSQQSRESLDGFVPVLADLFTRRTISAGTIVWHAGDQPDSVIVIVASGTLHMQRQYSRHGNPTGNTTIFEVATALSLLGHLSTFAGSKRHATLIASTTCDILELSRSRFTELTQMNPEAALILADAALVRSYDESAMSPNQPCKGPFHTSHRCACTQQVLKLKIYGNGVNGSAPSAYGFSSERRCKTPFTPAICLASTM